MQHVLLAKTILSGNTIEVKSEIARFQKMYMQIVRFAKKNGIFQMKFSLKNNTFRQKNDGLNLFIGYFAIGIDIYLDFVENGNDTFCIEKTLHIGTFVIYGVTFKRFQI